MVELVDTYALGAYGEIHKGSSPFLGILLSPRSSTG